MEINGKQVIKPLSEEEIAEIVKANDEHKANAKIFFNYGRMRNEMKLDRFEEQIKKANESKKAEYKEEMIQRMKANLQEYKEENDEIGKYYNFGVRSYADGRTMILGMPGFGEKKMQRSILIEEYKNKQFFEECLSKFQRF